MAVCLQGARKGGPARDEAQGLSARPEGRGGPRRRRGGEGQARGDGALGPKPKTQLDTWCRLYREGGPDALLPKPRGRPRRKEPSFSSREGELEARVRELELELEIQKRINALADEIGQGRRTR